MSDNDENYNIKYQLVLSLANKILVNIGKTEIKELSEFNGVIRTDLITDSNLQIINDMEDELYKYFDKIKSGYYFKKDSSTNYIVNCLRGITKQIDYKFESKLKDITIKIDGINGCRKKFTFYQIVKK